MSKAAQHGECATWLSIVSQLYGTRMARLLEPHGMTPAQFNILHHLARADREQGTRISDIAAAVEVNQPAVTKAIAKFEAMALVTLRDDADDKRAKRVTATQGTDALLSKIHSSLTPELAQMFEIFGAEELAQFSRTLQRLGQHLDQMRDVPS